VISLAVAASPVLPAIEYPGPPPGPAQGSVTGRSASLENAAIAMSWTWADGRLRPGRIVDKRAGAGASPAAQECFSLVLGQTPDPRTRTIKASELKLASAPALKTLAANPKAARLGDRFPGREILATLTSPEVEVRWRAVLRDGANYIRQEVSVRAARESLEVAEIVILELRAPRAEVIGKVDGSPVVAANWFFGAEHPAASNHVPEPGAVRCGYPFGLLATRSEALTISAVAGVIPDGQMRRGFLYYLERERAHPYRPFLHHNNGEQIGLTYWNLVGDSRRGPTTQDPKTLQQAARYRAGQEREWMQIIDAVGRELVERRGVKMDSFVHDYAWDDENLVWQFHNGFPNGFAALQEGVAKYRSALGIWFSPWGGYPGKKARTELGRKQGLEVNQGGLSLAGPRYYTRFQAACLNLMRKYRVNYYKFDGFAGSNSPPGAGEYRSDVEALWRLMEELRAGMPDVFINPSSGTWASPFWLLRADSIWRGGGDAGIAGSKGSLRQQWITYRDFEVHNRVLTNGPLYPITSLMIHGVMICRTGRVKTFDEPDMIDEIRSFFATGANVQELYVEPEVMTPAAWDALAESAKWSRSNSGVLADNHWVGGDPGKNEVYGWAAWSPAKGILSLRNPSDAGAEFALDIGKAFELPGGAARKWTLKSPWKKDAGAAQIVVTAGSVHKVALRPFEVKVFEAAPAAK
jgi:hypothetical protein